MPTLDPEVAAKRVAVARDVLSRLRPEDATESPLTLTLSSYVAPVGDYRHSRMAAFVEQFGDDDLQPHVDEVQSQCAVCGLGAFLMSYARLYDAVPVRALVDERIAEFRIGPSFDAVAAALRPLFDAATALHVEAVFQGWEKSWLSPAERIMIAINMTAEGRLADICEYIVAHGGEFLP